jgi:hypothetical protein
MPEQDWHREARIKLVKRLKESYVRVEDAHGGQSDLGLFRGRVGSANHLSDADIIVFSSRKKICRIIEIESAINPKKIIGIVVATHLCTTCHRVDNTLEGRTEQFSLRKISLEILYRKQAKGANTSYKLNLIKRPLKKLIKTSKGCLIDFSWKPI